MLTSKLFTLLAVIAGAIAIPVHKRASSGLPFLGGVNLAGCDFGMSTGGKSGTSQCPPLAQIAHFVNDGANVIRLPVGWQYLVGGNSASTSFDESFIVTYDALVQEVLNQGAYPIIDIHNYARWDDAIIGQGGPPNEDFASLWSLLATKYANDDKVIFGLMNEPHEVDISKWAVTLQTAVDAIRKAGATTQAIILPGNDWTHIADYYNGANDPVLTVMDGADTSKLILEVHQYLDSGSGGSPTCQTNGTDELKKLSAWLVGNGRQAILTETGGGDNDGCIQDLGAELAYVKENADTIVGFTVWAAGSFQPAPSYELSITPTGTGSDLVDNDLFNGAVKPNLPGSSGTTSSSPGTTIAPSAVASATMSSPASSIAAVGTSSVAAVGTSSVAAVETSPVATDAPIATDSPTVTASPTDSVTLPVPPADLTTSVDPVEPTTSVDPISIPAITASAASMDATPVSSGTPSMSLTSAAMPATSGTTGNSSGGLQTYTGALGGISAPAVTASGTTWTSSGRTYNFLIDALDQACYVQMDQCQAAANKGGNQGELTVEACNGQQIKDCLDAATASASA